MKYNFDEILPRRGTHSIKWDASESEDILPMWIADMDFKPFPPIIEALERIARHRHYGYNTIPDEFYESIILWWKKRHQFTIRKEWILPSTGVVAGISAILNTLTQQGDEVIIQTPAYNHFSNVIHGCRCKLIANDLIYKDGNYTLDLQDLERKAASKNAKVLLLCNPHNPVGRAWSKQELQEIALICARHHLYVIADEIHADLVYTGTEYNSFLSAATKNHLPSFICSSASKTFNLSGLHAAYIFVKDEDLRKRIEKQLWAQGAGTPSLMACEALKICYSQGDEWLDELNNYLFENYTFLKAFLAEHISCISVLPLEATYLVWLDCKRTGKKSHELSKLLLADEKLWVNSGDMYGASGEGFLRINIACPRQTLEIGLNRLKNLLVTLC